MNEGMLTNIMMILGIIILILIINFYFRKHSRILFWTEGLSVIIGTLLGIGIGWVILFLPDGYPNFPVITAVTIVFLAGTLFIIMAEKMNKQTEKRQSNTKEATEVTEKKEPVQNLATEEPVQQSHVEEKEKEENPDEFKTLPLKGKLDTPLARIVFKKALESGIMTIEKINEYRQYYHWNGTKVLLAYMCGRIYCGDTGWLTPDQKEVLWKGGEKIFPSNDLDRLFNEKNLGQQRINRLDNRVPKDFETVDELFF